LIKAIIDNKNIKTEIFNSTAEIVSLICIMIYLELNFCNLNHNLKKNIENRGIFEYNNNHIYDEIDTNSSTDN